MFTKRLQSGFTLMEILVVVSVVLILAGSLVGIGKFMTVRAQIQLCESQVEVICTSLEQYYDDYGAFPFNTETGVDTYPPGGDGVEDYLAADLAADLSGALFLYDVNSKTRAAFSGELLEVDGNDEDMPYASGVGMYYFLYKSPNSRKIIDAVSGDLVTNRDTPAKALQVEQPPASGNFMDLPRFVDPWGLSLRYEYLDGTAFPVVTSAGPDGDFETADDNIISQ